MTKEELTHNVAKCYNSLPDDCEKAMETLICTTAYFIKHNVNINKSSFEDGVRYFGQELVRVLRNNEL